MHKTVFKIAKMDCPSEEQMIRMKLANQTNIQSLEFDVPKRQLTVLHSGSYEAIFQQLNSLQFDTSIIDSIPVDNYQPTHTQAQSQERSLLWQVLAINLFFFLLEWITGWIARSMGLLADGLDMLADTLVYALALWATNGTVNRKKYVAQAAGYFQLVLAIGGLIEVFRRFIYAETLPNFQTMMLISLLALMGNAFCLYLLQKSRSQEAHMKASMIFTSNDVIVNLGVIVAGGLVYFTQSPYPDLIVGTIVFLIVTKGAGQILKLAQ